MIKEVNPARARNDHDYVQHVPVHVVWEITLACNLKCQHCGSRAGKVRPDELTLAQCLEVVESLARLGTREVTLIGGEAFLKQDYTEIIRAIRAHGMYCGMQTGAWAFNERRLDQALEAGLQGIGVSIDGLAPYHDQVRGVKGSYQMAMNVLKRAKAAGMNRSANTQIGRETMPQLRELMHNIIDAGAQQWQIQMTVAMGNAVENDDLIMQPYDLDRLMPLLSDLFDEGVERGLTMVIGNNIGYYGPYEYKLRNITGTHAHWAGCNAGHTTMGIEANGIIKGCPSLPTNGYAGGNVKDLTVEEIWNTSPEIHFGRLRDLDSLWGFCKSCYYAEVCRAGCTWTSHSLLGRPGNNPYCHYRVTELKKQGLRERIQKVEEAGGASFDIGRFELVLEEIPTHPNSMGTPIASSEAEVHNLLNKPISGTDKGPDAAMGDTPPEMEICHNCNQFLRHNEAICPHCQADTKVARQQHLEKTQQARAAMDTLSQLLNKMGVPTTT